MISFLARNFALFPSVDELDSSRVWGEHPLECFLVSDIMNAFAKQLRVFVSDSFLMLQYGPELWKKFNPSILEVFEGGYPFNPAYHNFKTPFPKLRILNGLGDPSAAHDALLGGLTRLTRLAIHPRVDWRPPGALLHVVAQNPYLKRLDISCWGTSTSRLIQQLLPDYLASAHRTRSANEVCRNLFGLPASRVRFEGASLWTLLMLSEESGLFVDTCHSIFQDCHGESDDHELVEILIRVLNSPSKSYWKKSIDLVGFFNVLEPLALRLVDQTILAGRIASVQVVLIASMMCRLPFLPTAKSEEWWTRFLALLDNAEIPPGEIFSRISSLSTSFDPAPWILRCLSSRVLRSRFPAHVLLGDISVIRDDPFVLTILADDSVEFVNSLSVMPLQSAEWAIGLIADHGIVPLPVKKEVIRILKKRRISSFDWLPGAQRKQLPLYFGEFLTGDAETQTLCIDTIYVFPRLLHLFAKPKLAIECMRLHGNLELVSQLVPREVEFMPGLLESPFQSEFAEKLWKRLLSADSEPDPTPLGRWLQCLREGEFATPLFITKLRKLSSSQDLLAFSDAHSFDLKRVLQLCALLRSSDES